MLYRVSYALLLTAVLLTGAEAQAQVHFSYVSNTGNNATVAIPTSANPNISGTPLATGDEIGAFTPAGLCVGAVVWTGVNTALTVWGDNDLTGPIDGIRAGEQILYRIWRQSTNTEFTNVTATYSQGNGVYAPNGIYVLSSLSASGPTVPPQTPTLSSPANGATGVSITPTLSWNASSGATSYGLQVSTSSSFSSTVLNQTGITTTSYTVSGLANNTTYYWRVNASNAGGTSAHSATWSFTTAIGPGGPTAPSVPTLVSPADGAAGLPTNLTVSWNASSGATSYRLQVSTSAAFSTLILDQSGLSSTSYNLASLATNTTYYWRVNASNAGGTSDYSIAWSFTTGDGLLPVPTLLSPQGGAANVSTSVTVRWSPVSGALSYGLQVSTDRVFATIVLDQSGISATSYMLTGLAHNTTYYWRVNASNASGNSPYSSAWSFTTIIAAPQVPTLSSPIDRATGVSTDPILTWNTAGGATYYNVEMSTSSSFLTTIVDQGGITATFLPVSGLNGGTTYYWRVNALNPGGVSGWSTVWSFTTIGVTAVDKQGEVPESFLLHQNYPNPFNNRTVIAYESPARALVWLEIYDIQGKRVDRVEEGIVQPGYHRILWGSNLSSGIYYYRLIVDGNASPARKMVILR